ncbi:MAG TPA: HAMP domain-containing sensor histidine kinase [Conexibacter sp.]|nr:HAMP domain-containing sensor histidine kinase [Conexibacter sp.]
MTARIVAAAVALGLLLSALVGVVYDWHGALTTAEILVPVGAATALLAGILVRRRARLGGLRRQLALGAVLALAPLLLGTALFTAVMFLNAHDAFLTALLAIYATALGGGVSWLIARGALADIVAIEHGLERVGGGERQLTIATGGGDELAALGAGVEEMTTKLAAEERARRDLIQAISHDLRTPLTSLRLLAEAVDDGIVDSATQRDYLGRMTTHVRALGGLIDDLFELSRLEAGDIHWTLEHVPLDALIAEAVEAMQPQAAVRSIAVRAETPPATVPAEANPEQIQRVLFNLIQNAIRHTPADGSITVRLEPAGERVEIEVADTGPGIVASERERIFDAFYRGGDGAARSDGGAGLGLAICRAIVEAHGGAIWLADGPTDGEGEARGARVRFSLRCAAASAASAAEQHPGARAPLSPS